MSPKEVVILVAFIVCVLGVLVGAMLGLAGIWVENFGKLGFRLFLTDVVITLACLIVAGLTAAFWKGSIPTNRRGRSRSASPGRGRGSSSFCSPRGCWPRWSPSY